MKQGRTLAQLHTEVMRRENEARDFLVSTNKMQFVDGDKLSFGGDTYGVTDIAHSQIGTYLGIPSGYYNKMRRESPQLLSENVNHWLGRTPPVEKMVRTLDGNVRAFLTDKYKIIDNLQVLQTALPIISALQGASIESCEVTDSNMYIKIVSGRLKKEVRKGDIVQAGVLISNSEVGLGCVRISPLVYRLVCTNGMVVGKTTGQRLRKYHRGKRLVAAEDLSVLRDDLDGTDEKSLFEKIRDAIQSAVDMAVLEDVVRTMREASEAELDGGAEAMAMIDFIAKDYRITVEESRGVFERLRESGDYTLYGISNAITRYAQDVSRYDRSTELEAIGYNVLTMSGGKWGAYREKAKETVVSV